MTYRKRSTVLGIQENSHTPESTAGLKEKKKNASKLDESNIYITIYIHKYKLTSKRGRKSVGNTVFPSYTAPDDEDDEGAGGMIIPPGDDDLILAMCGTSLSHDRTTRRRMRRFRESI